MILISLKLSFLYSFKARRCYIKKQRLIKTFIKHFAKKKHKNKGFFTTWHCMKAIFFIQKVKMRIPAFYEKFNDFFRKSLKNIQTRYLLILSPIFFILIIYAAIIYNSKLKEQRMETITSFLSNNNTILLKNYLLNQMVDFQM